jgi:hypothetical protein
MHKRIDAVIRWCVASAKFQQAPLVHMMHTGCPLKVTSTVLLMVQTTPGRGNPRQIIAALHDEAGLSYRAIGRKIADVLNDPKAKIDGSTLSRIAAGENSPSERTREGLIALHAQWRRSAGMGFAESPVEQLGDLPPDDTPVLDPGQSLWRVKSRGQAPAGYLPGDLFILDQNIRPVQDKDHVLVNVETAGGGRTVMGTYQRGFLIPPDPDRDEIIQIDGDHAVLMGVIVRSWRARR